MSLPGVNDEIAESDAIAQSSRPLRVRTIEILWHCNDRNEEAELLGMQSSVMEGITSIDYNPRFDRIVTTGGDGNIRLWQMHTAAIDAWLANTASDMLACCRHLCRMRTAWMPLTARWSPQGEIIASAHCDGKICLWWRDPTGGFAGAAAAAASDDDGDVEEWKAYRHLTGHISDVYDLCFSADSRYLLSGAGDGSIVIHDLEASTMPVMQLADLHTKFCRGVAWDPWTRYVHSFGCGPSLLCFTHVPKGENHRRMHLAGQRKCQGDFIGESCALSYRRLGWSPDGLLLAVPYGKFSRANAAQAPTTANLLASIEAKERQEARQTLAKQGSPAASTGVSSPTPPQPQKTPAAAAAAGAALVQEEKATGGGEEVEDDMLHCVHIYSRGAPDKVACRLGVRGYSEVRGVAWAPCFLEPLPAEAETPCGDVSLSHALVNSSAAAPGAASPSSTGSAAGDAEAARQRRGAWGPADYRMALAVWTSDAVIVYTTDSSTRHSDFTDLHMRSITDVAWSSDASHLYTASLDGYISVIAFGTSLAVSHRRPTFSASPAVRALCALMERIEKVGAALEDHRSSSSNAEKGGSGSNAGGSGATTSVAVVRKKKKVEKAVVPAAQETKKDVDMQQLEALMSDI